MQKYKQAEIQEIQYTKGMQEQVVQERSVEAEEQQEQIEQYTNN